MNWLCSKLLVFTIITSLMSLASVPSWAISCQDLFKNPNSHRAIVKIEELNKTDKALWQASEKGEREVGVVELLDANGNILAATDFVYQASQGTIIQRDIHVPIKETFTSFLQEVGHYSETAMIRFTHVHPRTLTSSGVLHIGANWIFSPGDKQAGYVMKFMMEQAGLQHLDLEMHLVYQPPFHRRPKKKYYNIRSNYSWADGHYSLGRENDARVESMLGITRN